MQLEELFREKTAAAEVGAGLVDVAAEMAQEKREAKRVDDVQKAVGRAIAILKRLSIKKLPPNRQQVAEAIASLRAEANRLATELEKTIGEHE